MLGSDLDIGFNRGSKGLNVVIVYWAYRVYNTDHYLNTPSPLLQTAQTRFTWGGF